MLELKLKIDGKQRTFKQKDVSARTMRNMMSFYVKAEKAERGQIEFTELDMIDEMILLVANIFTDPEVNFDSILDGLSADELFTTLQGVIESVMELGKLSQTNHPAKA